MKTGNSLGWMLILVFGAMTSELHAQGRGREDKENGNREKNEVREHPNRGNDNVHANRGGEHETDRPGDQRWTTDRDYNRDHHDRSDSRNRDRDGGSRYDRDGDRHANSFRYDDRARRNRYITYTYHRHGRPIWAPKYGYRYNTRYVYYKDYNVYYDCHRNVFIVWTGRNWGVTKRIPEYMNRIDFNRASVRGVEYWDDDFDSYLQRRRPAYVSLQVDW